MLKKIKPSTLTQKIESLKMEKQQQDGKRQKQGWKMPTLECMKTRTDNFRGRRQGSTQIGPRLGKRE